MKANIYAKLFLSLLFCMLVLLAAMMASVHWSFREGFEAYLLQQEIKRLNKLAPALAEAYEQHQTWDFLRDNPHEWRHLVDDNLRHDSASLSQFPSPPRPDDVFDGPPHGLPHDADGHPHPSHPDDHNQPGSPGFADHGRPPFDHPGPGPFGHHGPPGQGDPFFLPGRLRLLDAEHKPVVGSPPPPPTSTNRETLVPIVSKGNTIGWLSVRAEGFITERLETSFVEQQSQNNLFIALLALSIALVSAWWLTGQFVRPIRRIASGAKALTRGQYETQLPIASRDEFGQLAGDFNTLAKTLQRNEELRRQWQADISHELRTPLAILQGEIEAMQDGVRACTPAQLSSLHSEILTLGKLVDDLHELSVSDLGAAGYDFQRLALVDELSEMLQSFPARFAAKQLQLRYQFENEAELTVMADARRLRQLMGNLLENSLRYTVAPGFCEVSVGQAGQTAVIIVQDSAPGVPEQALGKLFDRLYRVEKSRAKELGGTGLGLAICKNIAAAHGGAMVASHSCYGGVCIQVTLPLAATLGKSSNSP